MPHILYYQQVQLNMPVVDVADGNRTNSIMSYPETTALLKDSSYVRVRSHDPRTFTRSSSSNNHKNTFCQQMNIPASMDRKSVAQPSLYANQRDSRIRESSPVQNQGSLRTKKYYGCRYHLFESNVEKLKEYSEKHGHTNVTMKENQRLYVWIRNVRSSLRRIQEGKPPIIQLCKERMKMLEGINFDFRKYHHQLFESNVEKLKEFIVRHGHMNVTMKENKSLHLWIRDVRSSFRRIQEGERPTIQLGKERMKTLEGINFKFSKSNQSFESNVEKLKEYIEKNGHKNVTKEENTSLYNWIRNVRKSFKKIQQEQPPNIQLSKERMKMLEGINFDFGPKRERAVKYGQKRSCNSLLIGTKDDTTIRAFKTHRREGTRQKMPPLDRTPCPSTSQLLREELSRKQSCPLFESSVEIGNTYLEENDLAEQFEEQEGIEIEGDLIPRWLLVGDNDEDEDQETSINEDHVLDDKFSAEKDFNFQD